MPLQPTHVTAVAAYRGWPLFTASSTERAFGVTLDATGSVVASTGSQTVTLTVLEGDLGQLQVGDFLDCDTGTSYERVQITGVNIPAFQFTATFAFTHSAGFTVRLVHGTFYGGVSIPQAGTGMTLSLFDGHPSRAGRTTEQVAAPSAPAATGNTGAGSTFTASQTVNVVITWLTLGGGETPASAATLVTIGSNGNNVVVTIPALPFAVTGANVYISAVSGGATVYKVASNQAAGTVTLTGFASNANPQPPTSNTTHMPFFQWVTTAGAGTWPLPHACQRGLYVVYSGSTPGYVTIGALAMLR